MELKKLFPSFDSIYRSAAATLVRFPLSMLCVVAGTILTVWIADINDHDQQNLLGKIVATCYLGLPLFLSFTLFSEKRKWTAAKNGLLQIVGVVLLLGYYLSLPDDISTPQIHLIRFALLSIGLHALVAWLPFSGSKEITGFWEYNKTLFLRFLTAVLYSGVLFAGLAIALAAADHLFGMDVAPKRYGQLWIIIIGLCNSWIFLAGVPENLNLLDENVSYPKGLKVFTQFILLPLVGLYFVILITYEIKIIFEWNWPKGMVSQLVLWYAVVGLLSLLLLYPLRKLRESSWVQRFLKWFFIGLIPLVVMLFLAIFRRISDYGITENRYFVLSMAVGLAIIMMYFIVSRVKDIKLIPLVLIYLAFIAAYGPGSAFTISKSSQINRLDIILKENGMLNNGEVSQADSLITFDTRKEISSKVNYLYTWHGLEVFERWFTDSTLKSLDSTGYLAKVTDLTELFGVDYIYSWETSDNKYHYIQLADSILIPISNYDYFVNLSTGRLADTISFQNTDITGTVLFGENMDAFRLILNTDTLSNFAFDSVLHRLCEKERKRDLEPDDYAYITEYDGYTIELLINTFTGNLEKDSIDISQLSFYLLINQK